MYYSYILLWDESIYKYIILDITFTHYIHIHVYQVNCKNDTSIASMQNFSKIKVTITVRHRNNKIVYFFYPYNIAIFTPFVTVEWPFSIWNTKQNWNVNKAWLYTTHMILTMHIIWNVIHVRWCYSNAQTEQYCHNELGTSALITTGD